MAFYLENNELDAFVSFTEYTIGGTVGDYIEVEAYAKAGNIGNALRIVGEADGFSNYLIIEDIDLATQNLQFRASSAIQNYSLTLPALGDIFKVRVERTATSEWTAYLNGASLGLNSTSNNFSFDQFFRLSTATTESFLGGIKQVTVKSGATTRVYDPSLSNGTGTALPTDDGVNQGAQGGTWPADDSEWVEYGASPAITDINANNEIIPGVTATLTGTNLTNATGITIGSVSQSAFTVVSATQITFTVARGGNPYNQNLIATLASPGGNATITVQQKPEAGTFAVTAASPNTTDDASLWTGLVDTATGDPVTVVDGDQALVSDPNNLGNLAVTPAGAISADTEGNFTVQFWRQSEGVWGGDQTVTFSEPDTAAPAVQSVAVPAAGTYALGDTLTFTANWSEAVTVTGVPAINFDIGGSARQANYASGSGTAATAFTYTVQSGDLDTDGVTVTSLTLDGGTIKDSAGNDATLTLNAVGDTSGVLVDGVVDLGDWPFGKNIQPIAGQTWVYGPRHPKTGMRVRLYK